MDTTGAVEDAAERRANEELAERRARAVMALRAKASELAKATSTMKVPVIPVLLKSKGRPPKSTEPLSPMVQELYRLVNTAEPAFVQRWFMQQINAALDAELEELALWVSGEWDPDVDTDRLKSLQAGGQYRMAVNHVVAVMRREVAEELREHKRTKVDALLGG